MKSSCTAAAVLVAAGHEVPPPDYMMMFNNFKTKYGKVYNGINEDAVRFGIFKANVDIIYATNARNLTFALGVNEFTDLTQEEFAASYTGLKPASLWSGLPRLSTHEYNGAPLASSVDWTTQGVVTPVKNQGQCGSCWSFSTTGALEGAWALSTGNLVSLSEQQFEDCDTTDSGCNGGWMDNAFSFAKKNSICTEGSYPYTATDGTCNLSGCQVGIPQGGVVGYTDVSTDSEQAMMSAVAQQPVSIAIEADQYSFQLYSSGVLTASCGTRLDHGVLAVGYGSEAGTDYWKVKNSWGSSWGEQGYVRLQRGKGGAGECGLLAGPPSYPVVSGVVSQRVVV
uniref:Cysteine protease 1 n=1 Tax=Noctiluca scintillans TaxID=2966 RepID=A7WQ37_NOCSC|nr:cysteine protease 1 [Noctiluca scintillans]